MKHLLRLLLRNLAWKLFSLAVAVVLWFTFVSSPDLVTSVSAPVEYMNVPRELEIIPESAERVRLEVRGPAARLRDFEASGAAVVLDLSAVARPGERTFPVTARQVNLPPGLSLVRSSPAQIRLGFDRRSAREVPVKVQIGQPPPPGYRVQSQEVSPARVRIVGPENRVREVESVETDPLDLSQVVSRQAFRVQVFVRDPLVRLESPGVVAVRVILEKIAADTGLNGEATIRN